MTKNKTPTIEEFIEVMVNKYTMAGGGWFDQDKTPQQLFRDVSSYLEELLEYLEGQEWPTEMGIHLTSYQNRKVGRKLDDAYEAGYNQAVKELKQKLERVRG